MKTTFTFLLIIFSLFARSQNSNLELFYVTYTGTHHAVTVKNPMNCDADVRFSWDKGGFPADSNFLVPMGTSATVLLPGPFKPNSQIKAKSDAPCSSNGWALLSTPTVLSLGTPVILRRPVKSNPDKLELYDFDLNFVGEFSVRDKLPVGRYVMKKKGEYTKVIIL